MPAKIVDIDTQKKLDEQIAQLQLPKLPPIVLLGDFDATLNSRVRAICSRALAAIAADPGARIIDNARCSSCAGLMGQAAAEEDVAPPVIGIVPYGRAAGDIDPNHAR